MNIDSSVALGVLGTHEDAEAAVRALQFAGFDMTKCSIIGRDYHTEERVVGYFNTGDRMVLWGRNGAFWGAIWGMLLGSGFVLVPGFGPMVVAGPFVSWILGAVEAAALTGGVAALAGALSGLGVPDGSILQYEVALKAEKFVVIVHGSVDDAERARSILVQHRGDDVAVHATPAPAA